MTEDLDLKVCIMLPSCVPATDLDESGAILTDKDIKPLYDEDRIFGLAEMMNVYGITHGNKDCIEKCVDLSLSGDLLNGYLTANISIGHECDDFNEAIEKLKRGEWIEIREGTVCKNLEALMGLFEDPYYQRCILVTDDNHADTLKN